ncbi:FkbM family methyltransferase [Algoriphagus iocasae]|uniref:FkbM family methyltransferase n=1 Tax=Algoriphagus iocasae TaxID=1836499 RepID=A0A841MK68_9BACT|nr:FkbM family methyltransferase [Algoriphagus iocasae]MBB6327820.1 FkbM family methyltransferase [Algoriphagus iocasae]
MQSFKSTLQLIEWSRKGESDIQRKGEYLLLKSFPYFREVNFYFRPVSSDSSVVKQHFLSRELQPVIEYFQSISQFPKVMVDAGGNIGAASRFLQLNFPEIKIIVIEPSKENCKVIKQNLNGVEYQLYPNALWFQSEKLSLDETKGAWGIRVSSFSGTGDSVEGLSLQMILNLSEWGIPDFLKIDIEGAEEEIFQNDTNFKEILKKVRCISIEPHSRHGERLIRNVLSESGFNIENHGELIYGFRL